MSNEYSSITPRNTILPSTQELQQSRLGPIEPNNDASDKEKNGLLIPVPQRTVNGRSIATIRTVSGGSSVAGPVGLSSSIATAMNSNINNGPGSFSSIMPSRTQNSTPIAIPNSSSTIVPPQQEVAPGQIEALMEKLAIERKMKEGAENLLQVLDSRKPKDTKKARSEAEKALNAANLMIEELTYQVEHLTTRKAQQQTQVTPTKLSSKFRGEPLLPIDAGLSSNTYLAGLNDEQMSSESPTWSLSDLLQGLEERGKRPEYYVEKANALVHLLKRHPALKYDLVWAPFGKRIQFMLCHDGKEVVAAGYRITRYAISDLQSLQVIRALNTDAIVIK